MARGDEFAAIGEQIHRRLSAVNSARETAIEACRRTIRASGSSIRSVHQRDPGRAGILADQAAGALAEAHAALGPFPELAATGPLHDAEKEYAEARLTAALVNGHALPSPTDLSVAGPAWLCGLAEAATELRRFLLDLLRGGELSAAEGLLAAMDDVYGLLTTMDYPDAVTGGLRRQVDALRAVLERTRGDITTTVLQSRLQAAIETRLSPSGNLDAPSGV